ncbi:MAG: hypothetical protein WC087_02950 [Candidatus Paceibacterota bacterium]
MKSLQKIILLGLIVSSVIMCSCTKSNPKLTLQEEKKAEAVFNLLNEYADRGDILCFNPEDGVRRTIAIIEYDTENKWVIIYLDGTSGYIEKNIYSVHRSKVMAVAEKNTPMHFDMIRMFDRAYLSW